MGGGSGIGNGAPVSPLSTTLETIEPPCKPHQKQRRRSSIEHEKPHYPPLGLQNVGNTCYANAALQCLLNTALSHALLDPASNQIFRRYSSNPDLLSVGSGSVDSNEDCEDDDLDDEVEKQRRKEARRKNREERRKTRERLLSQEKCQWLTGALTDITRIYTAGSQQFSEKEKSNWPGLFHLFTVSNDNSIVDPSGITRHVHKLSPCLRPYYQEDAHEFIRTLLSTLTLDGHNKQLSSLFDGLLESAVTCQTCHRASVTRDRYMDLSLDIQDSDVQDLVGALRKFTKAEILNGDNKVYCSRCDTKQVVSKGLRLATAPSILVCHLKRFAFDIFGRATRLSKRVNYPLRLEIGDFMSRANHGRPAPYELVGVVVHAGQSCERGHYYAYVKSGDDWYKANDEVVTKVDLNIVLNQQAYVLMYEIEGMRASHGFYGCGRYHLTRSRSNRKRVEDLAAMNSDTDTSFTHNSSDSSCEDELKTKNRLPNSKILVMLDSIIDFCGSTTAAEAVRDAMCDSEKKSRHSRKKNSEGISIKKAGPIVSIASSDTNSSRVTPSDDGSSHIETQARDQLSPTSIDRIRASSENDLFYNALKTKKTTKKKRDSYRKSGSLLDAPRVEDTSPKKRPSILSSDSRLIKSCSSNNLQEREVEAAHGYERDSYPSRSLPYTKVMSVNLHTSDVVTNKYPIIKVGEQNSDPGIRTGRRRMSISAPRAAKQVSPIRGNKPQENEKRIDLPPRPSSKGRS